VVAVQPGAGRGKRKKYMETETPKHESHTQEQWSEVRRRKRTDTEQIGYMEKHFALRGKVLRKGKKGTTSWGQ